MSRLESALERLYGWGGEVSAAPGGAVRALQILFRRSRDWPQVGEVLRVVQEDLGLPAPAVSVSGEAGFVVWFALGEPVAPGDGQAFLDGLRRLALPEMALADIVLCLAPTLSAMPACSDKTGRWSAFIDPGMGSLFIDEAGLDFAPPADRQADLLSGLKCIDNEAFRRVLAGFSAAPPEAPPESSTSVAPATLAGPYAGPAEFLKAVMNDPAVPLALRIKAAKALLGGGR